METMMRQTRKPTFALILALLGLGVGGSCGGTDDWGIAPGSPDDPRTDELRRRLDVRVLPGTASLPAACDQVAGTCTVELLAQGVYAGCPQPNWTGGPCETGARDAHRQICVAETLLRIAQSVESETVPVQANGASVIVPPQDVESQVDLARSARSRAFDAATLALDRLTSGACTETQLSTAAAPASAGTVSQILQGQHLASFVREAHHLIVEATEFMAERASAVSDAQQSRQTDAADAEVSELAAFASRAAAAHALVGGEHGLNALRTVGGTSGEGFFPQGRLSAQGARALEQFRASACGSRGCVNARIAGT